MSETIVETTESPVGIFTSERGDIEEHVDDYHFGVEEYPIEATVPDRPGLVLPVPDRRAIVRTDTNKVLGLVGSNYKVLTHAEALDPILERLEGQNVKTFKRVALSAGGAKMFANIYFPSQELDLSTNNAPSDSCWPGITVVNSLDGTLKYGLEATIYRLACTNGMRVPTAIASGRATHSKNMSFDAIIDDILGTVSDTDRFVTLQKWANRVMTPDRMGILAKEIVERKDTMFPARYLPEVNDEIKKEESFGVVSVWGLYNAFNSVLEHNLVRGKGKIERARMLDENLFKVFSKTFV